jgi:hypothetical protein
MFQLTVTNLEFDPGLQIIQGDIHLLIENQSVINETQCIDIGMPSLLRSTITDVHPNRWSEQWEEMPFFVCGCGDPDCKAYSFIVRHRPTGEIEFTEIEERQNGPQRIFQKWVINSQEYTEEVIRFAEQFLEFVEPLDYQPFFPQSLERIGELLKYIKNKKK